MIVTCLTIAVRRRTVKQQANQFRLTRRASESIPAFIVQALTTAHSESAQGPDLGLSGALCHFFMTSGLLSEEIGSLGAWGGGLRD